MESLEKIDTVTNNKIETLRLNFSNLYVAPLRRRFIRLVNNSCYVNSCTFSRAIVVL